MRMNAFRWIFASVVAAACLADLPARAQTAAPVLRNVDPAKKAPAARDVGQVRPIPASTLNNASRVALVIGNSAYDKAEALPNAVQDARDVCDSLARLKFKVSCHYDLSSFSSLRAAVRSFTQGLTRDHSVVFYYAGHGVQINDENYLLPTSIDPQSAVDFEFEGLSLTYFLRLLEDRRTGPNVVILDACRTDPFFGQLRGVRRGLAATEPPADTILVYATGPNEGAIDAIDDAGKNGLFAKHLLQHLETPGLKIDELFRIVAEGVQQEAARQRYRQLPYRNSQISQAVCFGGCELAPTATELEVNAQLQELKIKYAEAEAEIARFADLKASLVDRDNQIATMQKLNTERDANMARLDSRILELQRDSAGAGTAKSGTEAEIARLREVLNVLQGARRSDVARLEQQSLERDRALAEVQAREATAKRLGQEVDRYRKEIDHLRKLLDEAMSRQAEKSPTPNAPRIIIPSF